MWGRLRCVPAPWGIVFPIQRDAGATRQMLETLAFGDAEMPGWAGDYVIPIDSLIRVTPKRSWNGRIIPICASILEVRPSDLTYYGAYAATALWC